ncbi:MAG: hypothetical protein RRY21_06475 [Oscillospiraceae bacterium]
MEETEEPPVETPEEPPAEPPQAPPAEKPPAEPPAALTIEKDGKPTEIPMEEAKALAQKGLEAERLIERERQETARRISDLEIELAAPRANDQLLAVMARYAQAVGGTPEGLVEQMIAFAEQRGVAPVAVKKPDLAKFKEKRLTEDWKDFFKAYPDVKDPEKELPKEVWDAMNAGLTPRQAYIEHTQHAHAQEMQQKDERIAALETELATVKKNEANKTKSPGSLRSAAPAQKSEKDPFLEGLFEGFR